MRQRQGRDDLGLRLALRYVNVFIISIQGKLYVLICVCVCIYMDMYEWMDAHVLYFCHKASMRT